MVSKCIPIVECVGWEEWATFSGTMISIYFHVCLWLCEEQPWLFTNVLDFHTFPGLLVLRCLKKQHFPAGLDGQKASQSYTSVYPKRTTALRPYSMGMLH